MQWSSSMVKFWEGRPPRIVYLLWGSPRATVGWYTHELISGGKMWSLQPALAMGMGLLSPSTHGVEGEEPCMGAGQESSSLAMPRCHGAGGVTLIPAAHCQTSAWNQRGNVCSTVQPANAVRHQLPIRHDPTWRRACWRTWDKHYSATKCPSGIYPLRFQLLNFT